MGRRGDGWDQQARDSDGSTESNRGRVVGGFVLAAVVFGAFRVFDDEIEEQVGSGPQPR